MKGPITHAASLLLCGSLLAAPVLQAAEQTAPATSPAISTANSKTTAPTLAAANQQLSQLVQRHDYQSAYQLALPLLSLYEGDPSFDFYYAFSAAQLGYFNEAVFSFERLSSNYPGVARYRLELARAYYYLGNYDAAEQEFRQVKRSDPPAQVQDTIDQFLQRIQQQQQTAMPAWAGFVSFSGGYDSNYNTATDLNEIDLLDGLLTARLSRDQRAKSSGYYQLRAQGSYISPLTRRSAVDLQFGASRKDNTADDLFDLDNLYASGGMRMLRGRHNLRFGGRYSHYWLGGENLLSDISANLEWNYQLNHAWQSQTRLTLSSQDNRLNDDLDLLQAELQAGAMFSDGSFSSQFALVLASDDGKQDYQARDTLGLNLSVQQLLSIHSSLYASLILRDYQFQGAFPADNLLAGGETRADQMTQLVAGYGYTLSPDLTLYTQASQVRYTSNLPVYEYERTLFEAGINWTF
ncbi:tetratricopeptide repeat protein [Thalassolituus sp. UBA2009]|uniref:tetratricopeptide repeat protein n=1 Tax=Thalassolituus sp. UBA2009 TaxID=1947658 RepID=UPI00257999BD|nr:tetratricopeptide repeat protein [Thalassolituus sp. UBA2009]